jgi:hypothetical protein
MKKLLFILSFALLPFLSFATHQVSGYIQLRYVDGTTFQAIVVDYTNGDSVNSGVCNTLADRDTIRIHWGDGTSSLVYRSNGVIDPAGYPGGNMVCECRKVSYYSGQHTFPSIGNYRIWVDDDDRLYNIVNIPGSVSDDFYIYNTITVNSFTNVDSLPVIANVLTCANACVGHCYYFSVDASVPADDSISYKLGSCLVLGGNPAPGYFIPTGAVIDPLSGVLSWCSPTAAGIYNFAILITRYSSVIIGSRTIQFPVDTTEAELQVIVEANCVIGINEVTNAEGYAIYPSPATDMVTINVADVGPKQITFYNMIGQALLTTEKTDKQFTLNISNLGAGVYFVNIKDEVSGRRKTLKLIKN